ncbi:something about silencing protein 10 [Friedmanniomyces endolithicus]|uniref:Something about silencing protein 10 n=1 Tax=Friedmanniomyces endolithicus TaxID=329885 RepID=A0A4U0UAA6_9PEZI|nr:something about silencing protein 10 [Friedmanniomyces endolithicus]KAK0313173.1 something about silencing protein 10 [Friedmanniomyces endolithicus]KAK0911042.1 something about silencing protein 10 [Friedmanniomyces endolithicus]KAK0974008.1 something about silencing protein 10 [Friedmanniomyces endolithicus]KAK1038592.1 something about silencing protein 10 [Friedmanniomyces endolithicus]
MAKRKAFSRAQEPTGPSMDVGTSRKRIRTYEDVADSDDDFHLQRDEVLLGEEPGAKRRRRLEEQEEFLQPSDEEVLDYEDPEDEEDEDDASEGEHVAARGQGAAASEADQAEVDDEEDEEGGWGTTKADLYGADAIETEEQALEEEVEAIRLQKKQLQALSTADYGFDEAEWKSGGRDGEDADEETAVVEVLPQLQVRADMSAGERLKLLKASYPEFEPLRKELLQLQDTHATLAKEVEAASPVGHSSNAVTTCKFQAVSAYLGALTMYFSLLSSTASSGEAGAIAMPATRLRDHPVMDSLVQCRDLWSKVRSLSSHNAQEAAVDAFSSGEEELQDGEIVERIEAPKKPSRAQKHAEAAQAAIDARRAERMAETEASLADLEALVAPSAMPRKSKSKPTTAPQDDASDIGEEAPLTAREAADKAQRKKSLRFYTSQIAQKANKRGASGRNAGGDEDVPHRERLRDRQARLNAEAEKRGKRRPDTGADLDGEGSANEEDVRQAHQIRDDAGGNEYYDLVASRAAQKKTDKAALADAQRLAALQGGGRVIVEEERVGADGKRKISYLIEKNKGLTPHRKKEVRNPRVKKRKKYEEKKKKLGSMKAVFKGGEGRGGYGGEKTGIKGGLVKSTKL